MHREAPTPEFASTTRPRSRTAVGRPRHGVRAPLPEPPTVRDGVLATWHERNRRVTLPHGIAMLTEWGNLDNLRRAIGESDAPFRGMVFADSDVHKMLEAVAWELAREEDDDLRAFFEDTVALLARVQDHDGYLDSAFGEYTGRERWSDLAEGHELYCLGHLIQAGVAAHRALDDDRLLGIAHRFASLAVTRFLADESSGYCGHPLIETALIELWRETGDDAMRQLAQSFLERRGSGFFRGSPFPPEYYQDDSPALTTRHLRGHAVRALYLNQGIVDLHLETGDARAADVVRALWEDLVSHRLYVTGGTGSRHDGEAFGAAYELPPDQAYAETCAGVALFGWAWRMYLLTGSAEHLDVAETALYNVVAAGISEHGDEFTYVNPLQRRDDRAYGGTESPGGRRRWFNCACCPPNLARTFASLEQYVAAERPDGIDLTLYAGARIPAAGASIEIDTDYPRSGAVRITVHGDAAAGRRALGLRIPSWVGAEQWTLHRDGAPLAVTAEDGWVVLADAIVDGTVLDLHLPMPPVILRPHPRIDAVRGTVAVRRGPVLHCADGVDTDLAIDDLLVDAACVTEMTGAGVFGPGLAVRATVADTARPLYGPQDARAVEAAETVIPLRPYATSDGGAPMRVWLPTLG
ncbi:glycoside hydrolase family 127 protein [Microbacterium gorillae]|uniref:glycoside hydrolase family 127 protein n=1 Tax=Microbacterium gorillae TaxID=1231063 RepID=UPI000694321B|nr:beta-L-arabinofuranosidase domain-containing protein [Microbacterium gorillae]